MIKRRLPHPCVGRTITDMINWRTNLRKKDLYKHKTKPSHDLQQLNQNTKSIPKESKLKSY